MRRSSGRRKLAFSLRDEPPDDFTVSQRVFAGTCAPRQEWSESYTVTPLNRGMYRFGSFTLRWQGPLGLLVRQKRIPAEADVKVYPNLLDVQRYDLLLRRNRPEDRDRAAALLRSAHDFAKESGMGKVERDSERLLGTLA